MTEPPGRVTLSFHKVMFSAQEILDMLEESDSLGDFAWVFRERAEARSHKEAE